MDAWDGLYLTALLSAPLAFALGWISAGLQAAIIGGALLLWWQRA